MSGPHLLGRGGLLIALLASLLVCSAGLAQFENCPNPKGGNCLDATPGIPGCLNQSCCEIVCDIDPICCAFEWSQFCADTAVKNCNLVCGPGNGDCFKPKGNGTPGCDDVACCEAVCKIDPPCCEVEWDAICAQQAQELCNCAPGDAPLNDDCANAIGIFEGDTPFTTLCATPDGPEHPGLPCGQIQFPDLGRDVWFHYTATFTGTARAQTCGDADYNTELAVYEGCACPVDPETILSCDVAGQNCPGFGSEVIFEVTTGNCYTIRVGGVGTASGTGTLSVGADVPPKSPPNDDCSNALVLMLDQPTVFNNSTASTDGFPSAECNFFGQADIKKDIWYDFTPDTDGTFQVSLCGSSFDTKLAVYDGCACPTSVDPIVCNDDLCDTQSRVSFTAVAGQCYKIRAGSFPGDPGGPGQIEIIQTAGCPSANTVLTHSLSDEITPDNSIACLGGNNTTAENSFARSYDLGAILPGQDLDVNCVAWGIELNSQDVDIQATVNIYTDTNGGAPRGPGVDLVLLGSQPLPIGANDDAVILVASFDPPVNVPAGTIMVIELDIPDLSGITGIFPGSNPDGQTGPSYIRSASCELPEYASLASIGFPDMHLVNFVTGNVDGGPPCPADIDDSGDVGVQDLLFLLGAWGDCPVKGPCLADFDDSGDVGVKDLL
ncbi:MAG: hypothetical protein V3W34_02330, partial [Phycisphaerae bacterium]